jgi:hypothetical protein
MIFSGSRAHRRSRAERTDLLRGGVFWTWRNALANAAHALARPRGRGWTAPQPFDSRSSSFGLQEPPSPEEKNPAHLLDMLEDGVIVHYNTTSSSTSLEGVMSSRLVPILLMTAMLYALGASISSLPRHSVAAPKFDAGVTTTAEPAIPVLPTVTVRPDAESMLVAEATLLPTILVRPSAEEIAAARALDAKAAGTAALVVALHAAGGGLMPRSGLDMPYYSFGKTVYRLRKE